MESMRFFASKIFKDTYYVVDSDIVMNIDRCENGKFDMCRSVMNLDMISSCVGVDEIVPSGSFLEYVSDPLFEIELRRSSF